MPPGLRFDDAWSIGRVVVAPSHRGRGLAREAMRVTLRELEARVGRGPRMVSAQAHLERFYASLGFVRVSDEYDDDGIPHVDMRLQA